MKVDVKDLQGKVIDSIKISENIQDQNIIFVTEDGFQYTMFHEQDENELVCIDDIDGNLENLLWEPLETCELLQESDEDSVTIFRMANKKSCVSIVWVFNGESYNNKSIFIDKIRIPRDYKEREIKKMSENAIYNINRYLEFIRKTTKDIEKEVEKYQYEMETEYTKRVLYDFHYTYSIMKMYEDLFVNLKEKLKDDFMLLYKHGSHISKIDKEFRELENYDISEPLFEEHFSILQRLMEYVLTEVVNE